MLYFHYSTPLVHNNITIFSNMRYIQNQVILTGASYIYSNIEYQNITYIMDDIPKVPKILERKSFEPSVMCLFESKKWKDKKSLPIRIVIQGITYNFTLEKEEYPIYNFVATTLFKDDYQMLDHYIDYYTKLGVQCFFLYYNGKLDNLKLELLEHIQIPIHLTEWDYSAPLQVKVMSIADALYWGKNVTEYLLFMDLDEYLALDVNLFQIVQTYPQVTNFSFDCHWSALGKELIPYKDVKEKFYSATIFWNSVSCGNTRRKSLIRPQNIDIMRVHFPDSGTNLQTLLLPKFYHLCNFEEWNRRFFFENNIIQSDMLRIAPSDILYDLFQSQSIIQTFDRYICQTLGDIQVIKYFVREIWSIQKEEIIEGFEYIGAHKYLTDYHVYQRKNITKVGFEYFWPTFFSTSERLFLTHLLSLIPNSIFEADTKSCDVIYHSYFGNPFGEKNPDKKYIFFSGEKYDIPTDQYTVSFCQKPDADKVVCYPFFFTMLHSHQPRYDMVLSENTNRERPEHFCAFIVGNPNAQVRVIFFQLLSAKYKKVFSYGKVLNNVGYTADFLYNDPRQLQLLSKHKFAICFENTKTEDYYITEKLLIAKAAGCIPIYWGSNKCLELFDPNSFLYLEDDSIQGIDRLIAKIKLIDNNDKLYFEIKKRPLLTNETKEKFSKSNLMDKIKKYL